MKLFEREIEMAPLTSLFSMRRWKSLVVSLLVVEWRRWQLVKNSSGWFKNSQGRRVKAPFCSSGPQTSVVLSSQAAMNVAALFLQECELRHTGALILPNCLY